MSARAQLFIALAALVVFRGAAALEPAPRESTAQLPPIRHVFIIVLENQSYASTFGAHSAAPYLATSLARQGALLQRYYAIGHASLGNYIALISGQAPNQETQLDCPDFLQFELSSPGLDAHGQAHGAGCVYPVMVRTLPGQLSAAGFTWMAYMEDMGNDPHREAATCAHVALGARETTLLAQVGDQYAAKHNPFVYFHSIIDDRAGCDAHVVNLTRLPQDLKTSAATANYVFITPNLCSDGHDAKCVDGRRGGLAAIDGFLKEWVPLITRSPAFAADGMLIITFDESDGSGAEGSSACCRELPLPGATFKPGFNGPGGGRIGAVVISPFVKPGTVTAEPYNHYSLLRTVEELFGLSPLGYAGEPHLKVFGPDVFTAAARHPPAR